MQFGRSTHLHATDCSEAGVAPEEGRHNRASSSHRIHKQCLLFIIIIIYCRLCCAASRRWCAQHEGPNHELDPILDRRGRNAPDALAFVQFLQPPTNAEGRQLR
eukprot:SAG11_NODE_2258_length_3613_cov_1.480364_4_plen_104_part_00